ncbi:UPF0688 protein C1orf174 homolog isoform X2 [Lampris incognitus]|uniref:UPF0688 protein C1orf174 homolog isoform X2 n=1 Tax=Lampris incognitus TaxID=2546036 RepID=UPI0024B5AA89|nr:UPF0688 protein C1orf174 homolog isoform X2 [Lampris incognitus]
MMRAGMSGQLGNLRRRKSGSNVRDPTKASSIGRRCITRQKTRKTDPAAGRQKSCSKACGFGQHASPLERNSRFGCEGHQLPHRLRCAASPQLEEEEEEEEGKENDMRVRLESDGLSMDCFLEKQEDEDVGGGVDVKSIFPDDDSNQILPVEQFFGNLDIVQDCPQRSTAVSTLGQRRHRRRHYYAREDSDEEKVGYTAMQQDDSEGS